MTDSADRPNLLIFLTDDHAAWAVGCYGHPALETPTMDWLASTGVRCEQAYTPSPVCSPARASFFTGRIPSCHGIHDYLQEPQLAIEDHPTLDGQPNLGQLLQEAGYQTALIGKWHCGHSWDPVPGFERWYGYGDFQFPHKGPILMSDQGEKLEYDGYQTTHFTDKALEFLRERDRSRPFALFVGWVDTHSPHAGHPARLAQAIKDAAIDAIPAEEFPPCHGFRRRRLPEEPAKARELQRQYLASVCRLDEQVGRIVDEVDGQNALDQTLVMYTADHGLMLGQHGCLEKGNSTVPQNFFDESCRVPLLARLPGVIEPGTVVTDTIDHCDTWRTILDVAGVQLDPARQAEIRSPGQSWLPMARGEATPADWQDAYIGDYGNARCIRADGLKLIRRGPAPIGQFPDEFYDLRQDPRETKNRIDEPQYAEQIAALDARLAAYFARWEDPARAGWDIASQPYTGGHEPWLGEIPETP